MSTPHTNEDNPLATIIILSARLAAERAVKAELVAALENTTEGLKEARRYLDLSDNESFGVYETTGTVQGASRDLLARAKEVQP